MNHRRDPEPRPIAVLLHGLGRGIRRHPLELVTIAVGAWLALIWPPLVAILLIPAVIPWTRHTYLRAYQHARLRRDWEDASTDILPRPRRGGQPARAGQITPTLPGDRVHLRLGRGITWHHLDDKRWELASCLQIKEVRITPHPADASRCEALLIRHDPFSDYTTGPDGKQVSRPIPSPLTQLNRFDLWTPIPIGIDEHGHPVTLSLIEAHVLIGGQTRSGKSVLLNLLVAAAALDPNADLWLLDGKLVTLGRWAPCAREFVGRDRKKAITVLTELRDIAQSRYTDLLAQGREKIERGDQLRLHVLVIDELAEYVLPDVIPGSPKAETESKKHAAQITELLRQILSLGAAGGVIVVSATQKPSHDTIDTRIRDNYIYRMAFRCATREARRTILGEADAPAEDIPIPQKGVGFLHTEGERPFRVKIHLLDGEAVRLVAQRAAARHADEWLAGAVPGAGPDGQAPTVGAT